VTPVFHPDFDTACKVCSSIPCVVIEDHIQPDTELCGPCFFGTAEMLDWEAWNDEVESTE
jgi:hypothetical protein